MLHWTGKKWFVVPTPTPGGTVMNDIELLLNDVACTSAKQLLGGRGLRHRRLDDPRGDHQQPGAALERQDLVTRAYPDPAGSKKNHANALSSIRCSSPTSCWAVGAYGLIGKKFIVRNQILHWTGKNWAQELIVPNPAGTC